MSRHDLVLLALFLSTLLTPVGLSMFPAINLLGSSQSPSTVSARSRTYFSERQISVNFDFDFVSIAKAVSDSVSAALNREAFVKNLAYTAFYKAGAKYNVMVVNLNIAHKVRFVGVKSYGSAKYHGAIYGIWVFESGWFRNNGNCGSTDWAFYGRFRRKGGFVRFL